MVRGFVLGLVATLALVAASAYLGVALGVVAPGADVPPGRLETWAALRSLHASIDRASAGLRSPLKLTDESLQRGLDLYEEHCLVCHGASDGQPSDIAMGLNIPPPQFANEGVDRDPVGRTYWVARHGIRFSGMPSFSKTLTDTQLWEVALFLSKLDGLPPTIDEAWRRLPSMAPHKAR